MTYAKVSQRENHRERGDPAKVIELDERKKCVSCGKEIEENDFASLSLVNYGFYCNSALCNPPTSKEKFDGGKKISSNFEVRYVNNRSKEEVREEILETYEDEGYDMPSEEELDTMVEKRLSSDERGKEKFKEVAQPLGSL